MINKLNRLLSALLCLCFLLSCTPVFATEELPAEAAVTEESAPAAPAAETPKETAEEQSEPPREESSEETSEETPAATQEETSGETSAETSGETSGTQTQEETSGETSEETSGETFEETSGETEEEIPEEELPGEELEELMLLEASVPPTQEEMDEAVRLLAAEWASEAKVNAEDQYTAAYRLFKRLLSSCAPDDSGLYATAYDALITGSADEEGCALALCALYEAAEISCETVKSNGGYWVAAVLDGKKTHIDPWTAQTAPDADMCFGLTDAAIAFFRSGAPEKGCTDGSLCAYAREKGFMPAADADAFSALLNAALSNGDAGVKLYLCGALSKEDLEGYSDSRLEDISVSANRCFAEFTYTCRLAPTAITPERGSWTVGVGETVSVANVRFEPANASAKLAYQSKSTKYASVSGSGNVKGLRAGSTSVAIRTDNGLSAVVGVTVKKAPKSVSIKLPRKVFAEGESFAVSSSVPSGTAAFTRLYTSDDERVVSMNADGSCRANEAGSTALRVRIYNGKSSAAGVTVVPAPERVFVEGGSFALGAGASLTLPVRLNDAAYPLYTGAAGMFSFVSSDESVAAADGNGTVHGNAEGSCVITVTAYNGISCECPVTVTPAPAALDVQVIDVYGCARTTLAVGEKAQLVVTPDPAEAAGTYTYSSSAPKYISVSGSGVLSVKKAKSATITVRAYNGVTKKIAVTGKKVTKTIGLSVPRGVYAVGEVFPAKVSFTSKTTAAWALSADESGVLSVNGTSVEAVSEGYGVLTARSFNNKVSRKGITVISEPESVYIEKDRVLVGAGDTVSVPVRFNDEVYALHAAPAEMFTLSVSDPGVASVGSDGKIRGLSEGSCTVTCVSYNGLRCECPVTVTPAPSAVSLVCVDMNGTPRTTFAAGEKARCVMTLAPEEAASSYRFSSSSTKRASVSADGVISFKKTGTVTITVRCYNGVSRSVKLSCVSAPKSVSINGLRGVYAVGETFMPGVSLPKKTSGAWRASCAGDALALNAEGRIEAVAPGTGTVTVTTFNNKKASRGVTVVGAPSLLALSAGELSVGAGDTRQLTAFFDDESYALHGAQSGMVSYVSSDESVAAVDGSGRVRGVSEGSCVITAASYNGLICECAVTVTPAPAVLDIAFADANGDLRSTFAVGEKAQIITGLQPEGAVSSYSYSSGNTKYATVSGSGVVSFKKTGTVSITVRCYNGLSRTMKLKIVNAPSSVGFAGMKSVYAVGETFTPSFKLTSGTASSLAFALEGTGVLSYDPETRLVTCLTSGTETVSVATFNGKRAAYTVNVAPAPEEIKLTLPEVMGAGQRISAIPALTPEDSYSVFSYAFDGEGILSADGNGVLTALSAGTDTVTVTSSNGLTDSASVTVLPAPEEIVLDAEITVLISETDFRLVPVILPEGAYAEYTYQVADPSFFTLDETGLITPIRHGASKVTLTAYNGVKTTVNVFIFDPDFPTAMYLSETAPTYLQVGDIYQPEVIFEPESAIRLITWTSSNPAAAEVDETTGLVTAKSYGRATITGTSVRNPELIISYTLIVLSDDRCLVMPERRITGASSLSSSQLTSRINGILGQIGNVKASALRELEDLYTRGVISSSDYSKRKTIIANAFDMYAFPWMTNYKQAYWSSYYSQSGAKNFVPGVVYFGIPYTQTNRVYNKSKLLSNSCYTSKGSYYLLNKSALVGNTYCGNDCSSFVSLAIWGAGSSHASDTTSKIASSTAYKKVSSTTDLRPGDLLCKGGAHVIMFLYYANAEKTQMVIIEQGGGEYGINTCSTSIKSVSTYTSDGYKLLRLGSLG